MSNAPDRLDGFHTYNACCRGIQDTGRHKSNLARYAQDRRAYENWAEGDWRGANRLMGVFASTKDLVECPKCKKLKKMTGDHIGPISLGFCHRMKFNPLCTECNSAKNNRMTLANVQSLIADESKGEIVVSWHTKALWNALKSRIKSNEDAIRFSVLLRKNMHFVLSVLAIIAEANGKEFLNRYLNPQYASYDYTFTEFNPKDGTFRAERFQVDSKNTKSNAARYVRISFESLEEYSNKTNRRTVMNDDPALASEIQSIVRFVEKDEFERAHTLLLKVIEKKSKALALEF
jgi:Alw26I/Eco31I/Esp3I family type II restriction endonuclease